MRNDSSKRASMCCALFLCSKSNFVASILHIPPDNKTHTFAGTFAGKASYMFPQLFEIESITMLLIYNK